MEFAIQYIQQTNEKLNNEANIAKVKDNVFKMLHKKFNNQSADVDTNNDDVKFALFVVECFQQSKFNELTQLFSIAPEWMLRAPTSITAIKLANIDEKLINAHDLLQFFITVKERKFSDKLTFRLWAIYTKKMTNNVDLFIAFCKEAKAVDFQFAVFDEDKYSSRIVPMLFFDHHIDYALKFIEDFVEGFGDFHHTCKCYEHDHAASILQFMIESKALVCKGDVEQLFNVKGFAALAKDYYSSTEHVFIEESRYEERKRIDKLNNMIKINFMFRKDKDDEEELRECVLSKLDMK